MFFSRQLKSHHSNLHLEMSYGRYVLSFHELAALDSD